MASLEGTFLPPKHIKKEAHIKSMEKYKELYDLSIKDPVTFWKKIADQFYWKVSPSVENFHKFNFDPRKGKVEIKWMEDGVTNICYNLLDRHVLNNNMADKVAFYWEGNDPEDYFKITYGELLKEVSRFSNVLKRKGLKKGDKIIIYMPMIIELVISMLSSARIGVIHSIVFGGFSEEALGTRIRDTSCSLVVTADGTWRGDKLINMKQIVDGALEISRQNNFQVKFCIVVKHLSPPKRKYPPPYISMETEGDTVDREKEKPGYRPSFQLKFPWQPERDLWWDEEMENTSDVCEVEWMGAEDPLFVLYTSGSTGKPKGVVHTVGGYMIYAYATFHYVFDHHINKDIYFCTADIGWITGHTYVTYGPLLAGATGVMFEGLPTWPDCSRYWDIIDKYKVTKFYTAPTAIRALMKFGEKPLENSSRDTLEILGSVGEPINPEAWLWYHVIVGKEKCAIVDTFWQTETGGHLLTPLPGATTTKPGSATLPFFGVEPVLLNDQGELIEGQGKGHLAFKSDWPGIMRTILNDHQKFEKIYFSDFPGYYTCGDGASRDQDGYLWVTGRIDDMLNVSGHLISTSEVESVLISHSKVSEAAVVARPHVIKGQCLYCFVTLIQGEIFNKDLINSLRQLVRIKIAPFASPDFIQEAPNLPKTRSGKIMRRVLRGVAIGNQEGLGDLSTMADPSVIQELFRLRGD